MTNSFRCARASDTALLCVNNCSHLWGYSITVCSSKYLYAQRRFLWGADASGTIYHGGSHQLTSTINISGREKVFRRYCCVKLISFWTYVFEIEFRPALSLSFPCLRCVGGAGDIRGNKWRLAIQKSLISPDLNKIRISAATNSAKIVQGTN